MSLMSRETAFVLCSLFAFTYCVLGPGQPTQASRPSEVAAWKPFSPSAGRFEVTLPGMPTEKVGNSEDRPPVRVLQLFSGRGRHVLLR